QPATPPSAVPEQPAVAAASPEAPAASTAPSPAAPVAPATPAGQRQFIVKGPLPERQETDPAVRLAPNTVNSAASMPPPSPPTVRVAPTPAAPAATAPSRGVARPEILTDLTAGFYVQHIASPSRGNVEVFWRSRPVLRQARLLELRRAPGSQSPNFVLVSGPFESMEQAQRFMAQPGLPRDMWLREASKIRPLLPNP
ncbi:MAG: hypothetical protein ACO3ST_09595, partial [Burkholderiaceae bacterium]